MPTRLLLTILFSSAGSTFCQNCSDGLIIPGAVLEELRAAEAPPVVKSFFANIPDWIQLREVQFVSDKDLDGLDLGEREAFILAEELNADALLIDERFGREIALSRDLPVLGTLGILERAAIEGNLDFAQTLLRLCVI